MTLDQFVKKYEGKGVDWDGHYGIQCVDLFRQYVNDVLGTPQPKGVIGAKDFWYNYSKDINLSNHFTKHVNTLNAVPQEGDVIIWNSWSTNRYGHIAIYLSGNVWNLTTFDQNWGYPRTCKKVKHNYLRPKILGWLRPRNEPIEPDPCQKYIDEIARLKKK